MKDTAVELGDDALRAEALALEDAVQQELGRPSEAEAALEEAAVAARTSARPVLEARLGGARGARRACPRWRELASFRAKVALASLESAGGDRGIEADLERNLGTALVAVGDYEEGLEHHRRARNLFEAERGADSLAVATTDDSIGSVLHRLGRHDEALAHHRRALETLDRMLDPGDPLVGTALANVAQELSCQGEHQAALELYEEAVAIVVAALGTDHVKVAAISSNYAVLLRRLNRTDEALARYERAAEILSRRLGADHPDALRVAANVADLRVERGELAAAETIYRHMRPNVPSSPVASSRMRARPSSARAGFTAWSTTSDGSRSSAGPGPESSAASVSASFSWAGSCTSRCRSPGCCSPEAGSCCFSIRSCACGRARATATPTRT